MSDKYMLVFYIPSFNDEFDDNLDKYLRNKPYRHSYIGAGVTPYRHVVVENIPDNLVEKVKGDFFRMYENHPKRETFKYQLMSQQGYAV